jgi:hypothetical protein
LAWPTCFFTSRIDPERGFRDRTLRDSLASAQHSGKNREEPKDLQTKSSGQGLWKWVNLFPIFIGPNVKMANNGTFSEQIGNKSGEKRMELEQKGTKWVIWPSENPYGSSEMRFYVGPGPCWEKRPPRVCAQKRSIGATVPVRVGPMTSVLKNPM